MIATKTRADWVRLRRTWERSIVRAIIRNALALGYSVSVYNGGEKAEIHKATKFADIFTACMATDEETLSFFNAEGKRVGWVFLVYGNGGHDAICDYGDNEITRTILASAEALGDRIEENMPQWCRGF